jgi:type II secretory pathway pseudopilin PulG
MLRFFRQIRQRLLTDNKFSKYLLYAIGEIVLVVIGILIAISIDNWNQERILKREEQVALQNLKQDFQYNREALQKNIAITQKTIESNLQVLNYTGSKPKPGTEEAFNVLINDVTVTSEFFPKNSFLDDLMNSGRLQIIRSAGLREKLSSWKPAFEHIKEEERQTKSYSDPLLNFIIKNGSWLNADEVATTQAIAKYNFPKSGFEVDNRNLLGYLEFENMIENLVIYHERVLSSQKKGLQLIEEILDLINKEIKVE